MEQGGHRSEVEVGRPTGQQLDRSRAHTPYVAFFGRGGHLYDLGRDPIRAAHHVFRLVAHLAVLVHPQGHPEIGQFDVAVLGGQDVGPFDVPVQHALRVEISQPAEDLRDVNGH